MLFNSCICTHLLFLETYSRLLSKEECQALEADVNEHNSMKDKDAGRSFGYGYRQRKLRYGKIIDR